MVRLLFVLIAIGILVTFVSADTAGTNRSDEYTVQQLVIITFDDAKSPDLANTTPGIDERVALNKSSNNEGMNARKLFKLMKAAKADIQKIDSETGESFFSLTPTASQNVSIICKQCVPTKVNEI